MKKLTRHFNRYRGSAINAATYKKHMATNTATPTTETSHTTGLAQWLDERVLCVRFPLAKLYYKDHETLDALGFGPIRLQKGYKKTSMNIAEFAGSVFCLRFFS